MEAQSYALYKSKNLKIKNIFILKYWGLFCYLFLCTLENIFGSLIRTANLTEPHVSLWRIMSWNQNSGALQTWGTK